MRKIVGLTEEDLRDPGRSACIVSACHASSVWKATTVSDVPSIQQAYWQVIQLIYGGRRFVGRNLTERREYRVSSRIGRFDATAAMRVTASCRVYKLVGRPVHHADANYVWQ